MKITRLLITETIKLKRSLILLLVLGIPSMMFVMQLVLLLNAKNAPEWPMFVMGGGAIWAYFLLPMTATALTALLAQIEHGPAGWSHVLALPYPKWMVFAAKAILAIALMALISVLLWFALLGSGLLFGAMVPEKQLIGEVPALLLANLLTKMWFAGILVIAIQFTVAMAFRSFAVPVVVGIGGTFVALVATSAKAGIYFPWLLPTNILASDPSRALQATSTGLVGGLIVFTISCIWLSRRDWN